ncbi:MAG: zf-TFIIB domain-containing protein [Bacteroidia bacterium]
MKCPSCNETLLMTEKRGVEIDYCPSCRGIWLDRGELEKIMENTADHYSRKDNYEKDYKSYEYNQYDGRYPKKKKSFLNDFFDF